MTRVDKGSNALSTSLRAIRFRVHLQIVKAVGMNLVKMGEGRTGKAPRPGILPGLDDLQGGAHGYE
ncbi:MAG: hypothetical protein RLZZ174_1501, partial [Pseudomonadota bacterium]